MTHPVARLGAGGSATTCFAITLSLLLGGMLSPQAAAQSTDEQFLANVKADTKWLNDYGTRQIGTAEHAQLQADLLAKLKAIPNAQVWSQSFDAVVPVNTETYIEVSGGDQAGRHTAYPLWPDVGRLNTTPKGGITGKLIYIGDASFDKIPALGLQGQIAVMEMSAYDDYRRAFDFGAAAVIFVESDEAGDPLPSRQSLYKPRYYVKAGKLADALRAGTAESATIVSRGEFKKVTATNYYVAVKPEGTEGVAPYAMVAPYDSMSRVMDVAPGADAAVDCAIVLNLLRDQAAKPTRPLLFGFVDAYHMNQMGMRHMAVMLTVTPDGRTRGKHEEVEAESLQEYREALDELEGFEGFKDGIAGLYDRSKATQLRRLFKDGLGRELLQLQEIQGDLRLAGARNADEGTSTVRQITLNALVKGAEWLRDQHASELEEDDFKVIDAALEFVARDRAAFDSAEQAGMKWARLGEASDLANQLKEIFGKPKRSRNRVLGAAFDSEQQLEEGDYKVAEAAWELMAVRVRGQVEEQEARIAFFEPYDAQRKKIADYFGLNTDGEDGAVCGFVVGMDLSDCGVMVGPGIRCSYNRTDLKDRDFTKALKRATKDNEVWPEDSVHRRVVNIGAIEGRVGDPPTFGDRSMITSAATSFLLSGVTWWTDDAPRQRIDSTLDRYDQLDWDRLAPQLPPTRMFIDWLLTTEEFKPELEDVADATAKWRHGMGRVVDISAGETVPRVPRRGFLATLVGYAADTDGIRRHEFAWTGHDGQFRVPLMCADVDRNHNAFTLQAYRLDDTGAIVESLTTTESMISARLATSFNLANSVGEQLPRAVTFECTELNGPSFYDARFLEPLTEGSLLDAIRGGNPKQSHFDIDKTGQMWGLVEPGIQWQLVVRAGASGVRMAMMNAVPDGRKRKMSLRETFQLGFPINEPLPSIPAEISTRDLMTLNEWRLTDFRAAGIESAKINQIRDQTKADLEKVEAATAAKDGDALNRSANRALANELRAYRAITETGQDVANGAIFLMLMLVPFSIAMERLLFAFPKIGMQITAGIVIFTLMTLLLWSFHPAFKISTQPLVIVMAFTILAMSVAVIAMVMQKFRASMREFQSSLAEGSGAQMGRGSLLGSAIFLGIANMRKRKVRTTLTGITLVLVTFALLCFSSASSYVDKKDFKIEAVTAETPSVLIRRPTFGPITWAAEDGIASLLGETTATVESRAWLAPDRGKINFRIYMLNPETGEQVAVHGLLGLPANEHKLSGIDKVLPNWDRFSTDGGGYMPQDLAEQLGVGVGDRIVVRGHDVIIRGLFDPIALEDDVELLDGQRILPYDYSRQEEDYVNRDSQGAIEQETGSASAMTPGDESDLFLSAREALILPTEIVRDLGGTLRSIGIACDSKAQAHDVAQSLAETIVYPAYYANEDGGVNVVVTTPLIAVPPRNLAVPLVIAALIIFTTMLNSVSERKKEIYVYSSLGLAPRHIGALFIAESLTYGLMGAVFGYIAGQGFAAALTYFGWMDGITLNYSGTAVIKTMLLVQAVVVAAAIVPAVIAGRIASPSSEMDWKVPDPVDGVITSTLPFTVSPSAASGLIAFIHEYLEAHRDGVLGRFDVDAVTLMPRDSQAYVAGVEARVWLEPFDMGVRQLMQLTIEPPSDGVCEIAVRIKHETGTPKLWWRLNKPFFYELRRQMLGWRKVSPERMQQYAEQLETLTGADGTLGQAAHA